MNRATLSQNLKRLGINIEPKSIVKPVLNSTAIHETVKKAFNLPPKKRIAKASKIKRMFGAPNILYTPKGNVRKQYLKAFLSRTPRVNKPRFEQGRNRLLRNASAERALMNSLNKGIISAMLMPVGPGAMGGVNPSFFRKALVANPIRYAFVRTAKNGSNKVRGFALLHNKNRNTRYLELLAGNGYGGRLINQAVTNAVLNGKKALALSAVNDPKLRNYYRGKGFVLNNKALAHYRNQRGLKTRPGGNYYNNSWLMPMKMNLTKKFAAP